MLVSSRRLGGGIKVCGDAVLNYFWRGFAEIFVLTCGIFVLLDYQVCDLKKVLGHGYR